MSVLLSSGSNAHGQLSNGSQDDSHTFLPCSFFGCLPGSMPPETHRVIQVASGANHTLALLERVGKNRRLQTELWGCGDGNAGQLGSSYQHAIQAGEPSSIFRRIDLSLDQEGIYGYHYKFVSASWETTYVVLTCTGKQDVLISMGADDFGDLGIGGLKNYKKQAAKSFYAVDFGHLTVDGVAFDTGSIIILSLASGQHHVVAHLKATLSNGSVRSFVVGWGTSRHGQIGNIANDGRMPSFISTPEVVFVDHHDDRILSIALGNQHTISLRASRTISGLGSNRKGQLQGLQNLRHVKNIDCTWNGTYAVVEDNDDNDTRILATGSYSNGQLGRKLSPGPSNPTHLPLLAPVEFPFSSDTHRAKLMACGSEHVLALYSVKGTDSGAISDSNTEVWGWGWNEHGNLGTGKTDDVFIPVKVWPSGSSVDSDEHKPCQRVLGIWAGPGTSWIYCTA